MLTVATFVFEDDTLKVPVFPLTVNVVLLGYSIVPLVSDKLKFPSAFSIFAITVTFFVS